MFNVQFKERLTNRVELKGTSPWAFRRILDYIYTGRLILSISTVQDILSTAHMFQFDLILDYCVEFMKANLSIENCLGIYGLAKLYELTSLLEISEKMIYDNFPQIISVSSEWKSLDKAQVISFLESDRLEIREEYVVLEAALKWIRHSIESRSDCLIDLLKTIRLSSIPHEQLIRLKNNEEIIKRSQNASFMIEEHLRLKDVSHQLSHSPTDALSMSLYHSSLHQKVRPSTMKRNRLVIVGGINFHDINECNHLQILLPTPVPTEKNLEEKVLTLTKNPTWINGPSMNVGAMQLVNFSVVSICNCLVITGGIQEGVISSQVHIFDAYKNTWRHGALMPTPRAKHASVVVLDKYIYLFGGISLQSRPEQRINPSSEETQLSHRRASTDQVTPIISLVHTIHRYDIEKDEWWQVGRCEEPRIESSLATIITKPRCTKENSNDTNESLNILIAEIGGLKGLPGDDTHTNLGSDQISLYSLNSSKEAYLAISSLVCYVRLAKPVRYAKCAFRPLDGLLYIFWEATGDLMYLDLQRNSLKPLSSIPPSRDENVNESLEPEEQGSNSSQIYRPCNIHCGMTFVGENLYVYGGFTDVRDGRPNNPSSLLHIYNPIDRKWISHIATENSTPRASFGCVSLKL